MAGNGDEPPAFTVRNEFAKVLVSLDVSANGERLRVEDLSTGELFYLDALELERLACARHADLARIVAPVGSTNGDGMPGGGVA